jgi:uncharacterized Rmd1/YagE family protein
MYKTFQTQKVEHPKYETSQASKHPNLKRCLNYKTSQAQNIKKMTEWIPNALVYETVFFSNMNAAQYSSERFLIFLFYFLTCNS